MSTFKGFLNEYPFVALDYFKSKTLDASVSAYFLSHCHSDHMEGLSSLEFTHKLKSNPRIKLYTSEITKLLLVNDKQFKHLAPYLEIIPVEQPTVLTLQSFLSAKEVEIVVTLLPAGHCPGSVMFLIEGAQGTVLYTGDFRFSIGDIHKISCLQQANGKPKEIKSLYIDTTFCRTEARYIPSRSESLSAVISVVEPWLSRGENHLVRLICSAQYGYEFLFIGLAHKINMKVHVSESKLQRYSGISEIEDAVTSNAHETRIHACQWKNNNNASKKSGLPCQHAMGNGTQVLSIKLSAMWYAQYVSIKETCLQCRPNFYRVCYSTHSSLGELKDVVDYLQPKNVLPNVVPKDMTPDQVVKWLLPCKVNGILQNSNMAVSSETDMKNGAIAADVNQSIDDCEESILNSSQQTDVTTSHGSQNRDYESELDLSDDETLQVNSSPIPFASRIDDGGPKWDYEFSPSSSLMPSDHETVQSFHDDTVSCDADSTDEKNVKSDSTKQEGVGITSDEAKQKLPKGDVEDCASRLQDNRESQQIVQDVSVGDSTSNCNLVKSMGSSPQSPAIGKGSGESVVTSCNNNSSEVGSAIELCDSDDIGPCVVDSVAGCCNSGDTGSGDTLKVTAQLSEETNDDRNKVTSYDSGLVSGSETVNQGSNENASECEVIDRHIGNASSSSKPFKKRSAVLHDSGMSHKHMRVDFAENSRTADLDVQSPSSSDSSCCVTSTDVVYSSPALGEFARNEVKVCVMDCDTSSTSDDVFSDDSSIVECHGSSDVDSRNSEKSSQNTSGIELVDSDSSSPDVLCICDSSSVIVNPVKLQTDGRSSPIEVVNVDDDASPTEGNARGDAEDDQSVPSRSNCTLWAATNSSEANCDESDVTPDKIVVNGHCLPRADAHRRNLFGNDIGECTSTADIEIITIDD